MIKTLGKTAKKEKTCDEHKKRKAAMNIRREKLQ